MAALVARAPDADCHGVEEVRRALAALACTAPPSSKEPRGDDKDAVAKEKSHTASKGAIGTWGGRDGGAVGKTASGAVGNRAAGSNGDKHLEAR
jgi:hypothetical protein